MKKMFIVSVVAAADYVGQEWRPVITLEFETNGVYTSSFNLI